jgi:hypothetical protein
MIYIKLYLDQKFTRTKHKEDINIQLHQYKYELRSLRTHKIENRLWK